MIREEAIKWMEETIQDAEGLLDKCSPALKEEVLEQEQNEVFKIAISALRSATREQVEKVCRGEWIDTRESSKDVPTCMCSRCTRVVVGLESKFCPDCGSPMTDEAVEITLQRLEALYGKP